ncbi:MAG: hypothetical protein MRY83_11235 [Flavobacteriales bacterium]|nr:hypothetical protein [Flavobacteriales bacterium]
MKKGIFILSVGMLFTMAANALTVRYYNKDSENYEFKVKCNGSTKSVEFGSSRTSSTSIQSCSEAVIYTECGEVTVKDGDKITIKDGCITVD